MKLKFAWVLLLVTVGCNTPTAPAAATMTIPAPLHHNIPATMADGRVVWVCETQPRTYLRPFPQDNPREWVRTTERDHYIQDTKCPGIPIE
jgi:hypothetical protein